MSDKGSAQPLVKIGHYILGDTLGVGTFGKVKRKLIVHSYRPTSMSVLEEGYRRGGGV